VSHFLDDRLEDALNHAALRFDGYQYIQDTGFDHRRAVKTYDRDDVLPESQLDRLCLFFILQRYLMKWGGERLGLDSVEWKLFLLLFLELCEAEIPEKYRFRDYYQEWEKNYAQNTAEYKDGMRKIYQKYYR